MRSPVRTPIALLLAAVVAVAPACSAVLTDRAAAPPPVPTVGTVAPVKVTTPACGEPAPTTAAGYRSMLDAVPVSEWGAADVSLSVRLSDGRVVWLYGDTLSTSRFAHSTAIVQTGGCLHVSRGGVQLLPDEKVVAHPTTRRPTVIYWISAARVAGAGLVVTGRRIAIVGAGPWDFKDTGFERVFTVSVSAGGDLSVVRSKLNRSAVPDPGPLIDIGGPAHHFGYSRHTHPWAKLASGKTLVTTCQNWDDGAVHPLPSYRPIYTEE